MKKLREFFRFKKKNDAPAPEVSADPAAPAVSPAPAPQPAAPVVEPPPPLTGLNLGLQGQADAVSSAVQKDMETILELEKLAIACERLPQRDFDRYPDRIAYVAKEPSAKEAKKNIDEILKGCLQAYGEGRPENLRALLSVYMPALKQQKLGQLHVHNLCRDVLYPLVVQSATRIDTIKWFAESAGESVRQEFMDDILQVACEKKEAKLIEEAMDAGADPYGSHSRALHLVVWHGGDMMDTLRMMHKRGIDFSKNASYWSLEAKVALVDTQKHFLMEDKLDGFRQQIADLTAEVDRLKAAVFKPVAEETPAAPPPEPPKV